ncbi:MAG TPA: polyphosphate kinase 1, partial [Longimicrobiaceae bacterium]
RAEPATTDFFREVYFDTVAGDLDRRGVSVWLTIRSNGIRTLAVDLREREGEDGDLVRSHSVAQVETGDPAELFELDSEPVRLLRSMIDPARLAVQLELETLRHRRMGHVEGADGDVELLLDAVTLRREEISVDFFDLEVAVPSGNAAVLDALAAELKAAYDLRVSFASRMGRARSILEGVELGQLEREVLSARQVAVVAQRDGQVALLRREEGLRVPLGRGWGEDACRKVMRETFGGSHGRVRLLGTSPGYGSRPALEVWLAQEVEVVVGRDEVTWVPLEEALDLAGSPALRDAPTLSALHMLSRTAFLVQAPLREQRPAASKVEPPFHLSSPFESTGPTEAESFARRPTRKLERPPPETLLNMEVSELAFQERVLALAEHSSTPLLERVRFLSILGSNLDQFFRTRVAGFHKQLASGSSKLTLDGMTAEQQLEVIGIRVRHLLDRTYTFLRERLLPELEREGIVLLHWEDLDHTDRDYLEDNYAMQLGAVLTPLAADPSRPFPHIRNLRPALAVIVRTPGTDEERFAAIELPGDLPRFVPLPGGRRFIPIEEMIRASLPELYRGLEVVQAHVFRVTRSANISIDEDTPDLLQAVQEKLLRRPLGPVVRLEVEEAMPLETRESLLRELQFASGEAVSTLSSADLYPVAGLVDLFGLEEIADLPMEEMHYPPLERSSPLDPSRSVWEILSDGDVLLRFPYDSFERTVERVLEAAATDDAVVSVKITLYRTSRSSQVVRLLRTARRAGKDVLAVVELKASFDEQRNIEWARKLESAGIHVVYGPAQLKVHAKVMLIVRREEEGLKRYLYIGTGNLNAATAAAYTDLGLLTEDEGLGEELQDVFNGLTGYSAPTEFERLLVAPFNMRERFLELIAREVAHAAEGRGGHIRVKINGLTDPEIIAALYRASQTGVRCELVVRGLCSLRPGVVGLSENILVRSILGRFLEHARIYEFGNAGEPEYFIGSADWRPRNLSRRVEIVTPVENPAHRAVLAEILTEDLANPDGWDLHADGSYHQGEPAVQLE